MIYYDKPHYLHVLVDMTGLKPVDKELVAEWMENEYNAFEMYYPSDYAMEMAQEMSVKGHPTMKYMPHALSNDQALELFSKCLKKMNCEPRVRITPQAGKIAKDIRGAGDYKRIMDELLSQQDGISLSQIYGLANKPKIAYTTRPSLINKRIAMFSIDMGKEFIGKKKMDERLVILAQEIADAILMAKDREEALHTEAKYAMR